MSNLETDFVHVGGVHNLLIVFRIRTFLIGNQVTHGIGIAFIHIIPDFSPDDGPDVLLSAGYTPGLCQFF